MPDRASDKPKRRTKITKIFNNKIIFREKECCISGKHGIVFVINNMDNLSLFTQVFIYFVSNVVDNEMNLWREIFHNV